MSKLNDIVNVALSQVGQPYSSMDDMFNGGAGWGCAMLCAASYNKILGTDFYGSCYNFAGDICNGEPNQGFKFVETDEPKAGDIVLYYQNYNTDDNYNCGHAAIYIGDGDVVGAWGRKKVGEVGNWGYVCISPIDSQSIGGAYVFIHCILCDDGDDTDEYTEYTVNCEWLNVREEPSITSKVVAHYEKGDTVTLESWRTVNDGYVWGRYVGANSGKYRYIAIGIDTGVSSSDDYLVE
jgi:cell wall-associated NlpC family hydrolase